MKTVMVVLAYATLATSSVPRDKRSFTHAHTQAYPVPVNVHTVVRPSNTVLHHTSTHILQYDDVTDRAYNADFSNTVVHHVGYIVCMTVNIEARLPVYEYPESTQIDTHSRTVYSVSVPITHTVHLEQPGHSRQVIYHNPPALPSYTAPVVNTVNTAPVYTAPVNTQVYSSPVYTAPVYTAPVHSYPQYNYNPVYTHTPHVQRRIIKITPTDPWVYRRYADPWC